MTIRRPLVNSSGTLTELASADMVSGVEAFPVFSITGTLVTGTGALRLPINRACTLLGARLMVGTAPTGASIKCDVNKNGTTIFTTQGNRPTIAISGTDSGAVTAPDVTTAAAGDYITIDVDQVGSTIAGSNLVAIIDVLYT